MKNFETFWEFFTFVLDSYRSCLYSLKFSGFSVSCSSNFFVFLKICKYILYFWESNPFWSPYEFLTFSWNSSHFSWIFQFFTIFHENLYHFSVFLEYLNYSTKFFDFFSLNFSNFSQNLKLLSSVNENFLSFVLSGFLHFSAKIFHFS